MHILTFNFRKGGSMVIHIFGASFGLAFAFVLGDKASNRMHTVGNGEDALGTSKHNGTFAMIGTLVLFCLWSLLVCVGRLCRAN